ILAGITTMLPALLIIVLAWSIGTVTDVLGTAEYVVNSTESWMTPALMPFRVFVIGMFISFSTGTSWGTMAILTPIAVPLDRKSVVQGQRLTRHEGGCKMERGR